MNIKLGRGSSTSPTVRFTSDSDTGFYMPSGVQISSGNGKGFEPHYVVTHREFAEFRLYRLLDNKVPFVAKKGIVHELYKSFLVNGVTLDDRSSS